MPACHQCGGQTNAPRNGACSICRAAGQDFCATCALWELGPLSAPAGLPRGMRPDPDQLTPVRNCPLRRELRDKNLRRLANECELLTWQRTENPNLYPGKTFNEALNDALAVYDEVYGTSGLDRRMMRALITVHLSAQEVAVRHRVQQDDRMEALESDIERLERERKVATDSIPPLEMALAKAMERSNSRWKRRRASGMLAAQQCVVDINQAKLDVERLTQDIANRRNEPHIIRHVHRHDAPLVAAKHLGVCFYDEVAPARRKIARKALTSEVVEMVLRKKMPLGIARMALREEGGSAANAKKMLEIGIALYHARTAHRPSDGFQQGGFDPRRAPGYMNDEHRTFLFGANPGEIPLLTDEAKTLLGTLYASLDVAVGNGPRFADPEVATELQNGRITAAQAAYLQFLPRMDEAVPGNRTGCETEVRSKVLDRLELLLPASRHDATVWLDGVIADLRANYYLATSSHNGMIASYAAAPTTAAVESAAVRASGDVNWADVLPCSGIGGSFRGTRYDLNWHRAQSDGRQACWHYFDWRNDKDRALYDFFPMSIPERPIFVSLSMAEDLPEVDTRYGIHTVVWNNSLFRRAAFTLGDKGNPRRSMLLILRDLLYPIPLKDGSAAHTTADRALTFGNIHERWERRAARQVFGQAAFTNLLLDRKTRMSVTANVEAHVFGPVNIHNHARGLILQDGDTRDAVLRAVPLPTWTPVHYTVIPADRVTRDPRLLTDNAQTQTIIKDL